MIQEGAPELRRGGRRSRSYIGRLGRGADGRRRSADAELWRPYEPDVVG
jgi:hypothetical protein